MFRMQRIGGLLFLVAASTVLSSNAEDVPAGGPNVRSLRPEPRQIFRDGVEDAASPYRYRKRPSSPQLFRERQEEQLSSIGDFPLGPRPNYDNEDFQPAEEVGFHAEDAIELDESALDGDALLFNLGAFSASSQLSGEEGELRTQDVHEDRNEEHNQEIFNVEQLTADLAEYRPEDDPYNTADHLNDREIANLIEEAQGEHGDGNKLDRNEEEANNVGKEEGEDYKDETRSPAHRYPDEEDEFVDEQLGSDRQRTSGSTPSDRYVTAVPLQQNDFSPYSMFEENDETRRKFRTKKPAQKLTRSPGRFSALPKAQDRNFETRPAPSREHRRPTPAHRERETRPPTRRHNRPAAQPSNHNQIPHDQYHEEQRPSRPVSQHRPQPIYQDGGNRIQEDGRHTLQEDAGRPQYVRQQQHQQQQQPQYQDGDYVDYEDEEDKPDRLSELLLLSRFSCGGQKDGYYADEEVNCEVFHFCQDSVKHSWLCPNGAAFHQVHLICMPHSDDNICERSSKFHFVNDFLYKEVGDHPENMSYVERYYPQGYESGVANIPDHHDGGPPPQAESPSQYRRPAPPPGYHTRSRDSNRQHTRQPERETQLYHQKQQLQQQQKQQQQYQEREEERRPHQSQFQQRHQKQPDFQNLDPNPIRQESISKEVYRSQEINSKPHIQEKPNKPHFQSEKRKFQLTKPKFEEERPSFEHQVISSVEPEEHRQPERVHQNRPHERDHQFHSFPRSQEKPESHERRQQFQGQPRSPHHNKEHGRPQRLEQFGEGPSSHVRQHRPKPVSQDSPQPSHLTVQPQHHQQQQQDPAPVYRPHQTAQFGHPQQGRPSQGSPPIYRSHAAFRPSHHEGVRRPPPQHLKRESSPLNPLSFLG